MRFIYAIVFALSFVCCVSPAKNKMENKETNKKEVEFISLADWKNSILSNVKNLKSEEDTEFIKDNFKVSIKEIEEEVFKKVLDSLTIENVSDLSELIFIYYLNEGEVNTSVLKVIAFEDTKSYSSKCVKEANEIKYDNSKGNEEITSINKLLTSISGNHIFNSEAVFITKCKLQPKVCTTQYIVVNAENSILVEDIIW